MREKYKFDRERTERMYGNYEFDIEHEVRA